MTNACSHYTLRAGSLADEPYRVYRAHFKGLSQTFSERAIIP
ncbi:hypothetical protein Brsp02_05086 [Brucella sp. NBRC 113783]|jgi:hypothetical protein